MGLEKYLNLECFSNPKNKIMNNTLQQSLALIFNELKTSNSDVFTKLNNFFLKLNQMSGEEIYAGYQAFMILKSMVPNNSPFQSQINAIEKAILLRMRFIAKTSFLTLNGLSWGQRFADLTGDKTFLNL